MLVAVYGTLRQGGSNHNKYLSNTEYVGMFESLPIYSLYDVNGFFPGLQEHGNHSVVFEVFKIDSIDLARLDILEGVKENDPSNGLYSRIEIDTPFGKAFTYIYKRKCLSTRLIQSGDWNEYHEINKLKEYAY
jgi:gamma-glutamylcyclotransferase (GGCT)/AIG2-like uncharacterized protein YtfP